MTRSIRVQAVLLSLLSFWALRAAAQTSGGSGAGAGGGATVGGSAGVIGSVQVGPPVILPSAEMPAVDPATAVSIEGRVVNSLTGEPVRQANLTLTMQPGGPGFARPQGRPPSYGATSDTQGKFKFENLPPGRYQLAAEKSGYVRANYGAEPGRPLTPLTGDAGQKITDLEFKLTPQAIIAGKVLDENGEPVANAQIRVLRRSGYFRQTTGGGNGVNTNAIGEFLIGELAPGRYVLLVDHRPGRFGPRAMVANQSGTDSYIPTYYPGTTDAKAAGAITVNAGQEVRGVDVWLQKGRLYRVSGAVAGVPAGSGERVQVSMLPEAGPSPGMGPFTGSNANGKFVFNSIQPGAYVVSAMLYAQNAPPQTLGSVNVVVASKDIDDLVIQANRGDPLTVTGRVIVEDSGSIPFTGEVILELIGMSRGPGPRPARPQPDGTFMIENVGLGKYNVRVSRLPEGSYLKSITSGGGDVLASGLDLSQSQALPPLEILISAKAGAVEGVVKDGRDLRAGAYVSLLPEPFRPETQRLQRTATSDANGHFTIKAVPPGEYRLYAWQESFPIRIIEAADLTPYESYGVGVRVEEGAVKQAELSLVPIP